MYGLGAEVPFGSPRFLHDRTVEVGGRRVTARSGGGRRGLLPGLPPVEGLAETPDGTNEPVFSQTRLRPRLLMLGGGPAGLESAQAFQRLASRETSDDRSSAPARASSSTGGSLPWPGG